MDALFARVDSPDSQAPTGDLAVEHWLPTELSRGPWSPDALHGGPVAALMTRALERLDAPVDMRLVRVTVELLRPVPLLPLWLTSTVVRPGAKVGMIEASLGRADDGKLLAVARAQRIRTKAVEFGDGVTEDAPSVPDDSAAASLAQLSPAGANWRGYHNTAVEHRFTRGIFGEPGPVFDWIRLAVPVVPDEEPSGWQRATAAADFANGVSAVMPFDGTSMFINPDLTVNLWREPVGEWIGMDSITRTAPDGVGMSDTAMWDEQGRIGRGSQSLLLDRT